MADFAAFRRADKTSLTNAVRREVVVEHEGIFPLAFERIDDLRVAARAESRDDQGLGLTAREDGRAVRARQNADLDVDLADGLRIAAVDARIAGDDAAAHDVLLGIMELGLDLRRRPGVAFACRQLRDALLLELADLGVADLLLGDAVRVRDDRDELGDAGSQRLVLGGRRPNDRRTAGLFGERANRFDRDLHLLVAEHHGAEHHVFG